MAANEREGVARPNDGFEGRAQQMAEPDPRASTRAAGPGGPTHGQRLRSRRAGEADEGNRTTVLSLGNAVLLNGA